MAHKNRIKEGGSCRNCGKNIGSFQIGPTQTTGRNGKQFCSAECRREFQWGKGIL